MTPPARPSATSILIGGHPLGPIFIAADDGGGNWHEQAVSNGAIVDFEGGRSGAVATEPILTPTMTLLAVRDADRIRYVKIGSGGGDVFVRITDATGGRGKYLGVLQTLSGALLNYATNFTTADMMADSAETVVVVNLKEMIGGSGTHYLSTSTSYQTVFPGTMTSSVDTEGQRVVIIDAIQTVACDS